MVGLLRTPKSVFFHLERMTERPSRSMGQVEFSSTGWSFGTRMDGSAWQVRLLGSVESVSRGLGEVACENSYWMVRWLGR